VIEGIVGFEIIKDSHEDCIIESISEISYEQYIIFLNKLFQVIMSIQDILKDGMKNKPNEVSASIVASLNKKSSKYACLCRRVLTKNYLMNHDDSIIIFNLIGLIHMAARNYANCYKYIYENKVRINKETLDYLDETITLFTELYNLYLKKKKGALDITEKRHHLLSKVLPDIFSKSANPMILYYLAGVIRIVGTCAPKVSLMNDFLKDEIPHELL
ncbi:MAG: hypothetical protein KAS15_07400, partial [Nanoarchaeota archaeon]|nr:hypothetical protein [Nanoarchaeota archaeon]